jgi:hypothetical protein
MYAVIHDEVHNVQDDATPHVLLDRLNPQPTQPPRGESNLGDTSGPLFSLYYTAAEVADNKKVENWQKDADGILIFVSPRVGIHIIAYKLAHYRPVYFPPQLLRCLL